MVIQTYNDLGWPLNACYFRILTDNLHVLFTHIKERERQTQEICVMSNVFSFIGENDCLNFVFVIGH